MRTCYCPSDYEQNVNLVCGGLISCILRSIVLNKQFP